MRKRLTKGALEAPRDNHQGIAVQQMIIEPWQAEAMAATMEASLEVAYQEMAGVEERSNQLATCTAQPGFHHGFAATL